MKIPWCYTMLCFQLVITMWYDSVTSFFWGVIEIVLRKFRVLRKKPSWRHYCSLCNALRFWLPVLCSPQANTCINLWPLWNNFQALRFLRSLGSPQIPFRSQSHSLNTFWNLHLSSSLPSRLIHQGTVWSQTSLLTTTRSNVLMGRCVMCRSSRHRIPTKWALRRSLHTMP